MKIILETIPEKSIIVGKDLTIREKKQKEFYIVVKAKKHTHTGFLEAGEILANLKELEDCFTVEVTEVKKIK